jgi:hypothetical protein
MPVFPSAQYKHEKHDKPGKYDKETKPDGYKPDGYKPDGYRPDGYKPDGHNPDAYKPDEHYYGKHDKYSKAYHGGEPR